MRASRIELRGSLEIAERFLRSAERTFEIDDFVMVLIAAYNSVFIAGGHYFLRRVIGREVIVA